MLSRLALAAAIAAILTSAPGFAQAPSTPPAQPAPAPTKTMDEEKRLLMQKKQQLLLVVHVLNRLKKAGLSDAERTVL